MTTKKYENIKCEIDDLEEILNFAKKTGVREIYTAKWYADVKVIINVRISELNERLLRCARINML